MLTIGQKIKKVREIRGIKQETMAEILQMSQANYSKLESEDDMPYSRLVHISQALKTDVSEIINIDKNPMVNGANSPHSNNYYSFVNDLKLIESTLSAKDETIASLKAQIELMKKVV